MNISSVVIRTRPELGTVIGAALGDWPGVDIHAITDDGHIVATLEDSSTASAADTYVRLHGLAGVYAVSMIYQYGDDLDNEELPS